jgi:hypothetical protein
MKEGVKRSDQADQADQGNKNQNRLSVIVAGRAI